MANKKPPGMMILLEHEQLLSILSDEEIGQLFRALFKFARDGELPEFDDKPLAMAFNVISSQIQRSADRYAETCEKKSRAATEQWQQRKGEEAEEQNLEERKKAILASLRE